MATAAAHVRARDVYLLTEFADDPAILYFTEKMEGDDKASFLMEAVDTAIFRSLDEESFVPPPLNPRRIHRNLNLLEDKTKRPLYWTPIRIIVKNEGAKDSFMDEDEIDRFNRESLMKTREVVRELNLPDTCWTRMLVDTSSDVLQTTEIGPLKILEQNPDDLKLLGAHLASFEADSTTLPAALQQTRELGSDFVQVSKAEVQMNMDMDKNKT